MKNKIKVLFLLPLFVLGIYSCEDGTIFFSPSDDAKLGLQLDQEISGSGEYKVLNNPTATAYVQDMMDKIVKAPEIKYADEFPYKVKLIDDDATVNAFALPGGYIYVYTGLLRFIDNEATLAGVLAHEVAHAERRHAAKRMEMQYGVSIVLAIALGNDPGELEALAANLLSGLGMLYNSREDEYEADEYSFTYLRSTEWYPGGITYFFDKIESSGNDFTELLQTHPLGDKRVQEVQNLLSKYNIPAPTESNLFTSRYKNFKNSL